MRWILLFLGLAHVAAGVFVFLKAPTTMQETESILVMMIGWILVGTAFIVSAVQRASKKQIRAIENLFAQPVALTPHRPASSSGGAGTGGDAARRLEQIR